MFKKVHNINNPRKLIPAKKSLNGQTAKINTREMQFFSKKKKPRKLVPAKISTIKVLQHEAAKPTSQKYFHNASRFGFAVETYLYSSTYKFRKGNGHSSTQLLYTINDYVVK